MKGANKAPFKPLTLQTMARPHIPLCLTRHAFKGEINGHCGHEASSDALSAYCRVADRTNINSRSKNL